MKKRLLFLAVLCSPAAVFAVSPPANTADYFVAKPEAWLEKPVSLSVAWVDVSKNSELKDGYRVFRAETINSNTWGGYIELLGKPGAAGRIITLCGTQHYKTQIGVVPHMINGVFTQDGTHYAVKVEK